nr:hypothetical protein Itr_chr14CG08380 [Ipomoea trifida]
MRCPRRDLASLAAADDAIKDEDDFPSQEDCRTSVCRIAGGGAGFQAARGGDTKCGLDRLGVETGFTLFSPLLFDPRRWFMVGCGVVSRFRSECFMVMNRHGSKLGTAADGEERNTGVVAMVRSLVVDGLPICSSGGNPPLKLCSSPVYMVVSRSRRFLPLLLLLPP